MNNNELKTQQFLESLGHFVMRITTKYHPDFLVDNEFYVEHKDGNSELTNNQIIKFTELDKPVYILRTHNGEISQDLFMFEKKNYGVSATKSFIINIPIEIHKKFKCKCILQGKYMEDVIGELIESFIAY